MHVGDRNCSDKALEKKVVVQQWVKMMVGQYNGV